MVSTVAEVLEWAAVLGTDYALEQTDEFGPVVSIDGEAIGWAVWCNMAVVESVNTGESREDDGAEEIEFDSVGVRWTAGDESMTLEDWLELVSE